MTEKMKHSEPHRLTYLVEQYLSLESLEVTEELLELCGASIDARALPLLKRRLHEEEVQVPLLQQRGYIRMREKCEQLIASLRPLMAALEQSKQTTEEDRA
jgi:hypothetical protein